MTNTNYHIAFDRMMARGATFDIDAAYSNPAGLAWGYEGLQLSLNFQKPWQYRNIEATNPLFQQQYGEQTHLFEGKASAPIVPALFASYKKDRWAVSAMIGIVGSGGYVEYDEGVPSFSALAMSKIYASTATLPAAMGGPVTPDKYKISSEMKGKQYIYGGQLNFTYKILDNLAAAVGFRANYYDGYYRGFIKADQHPAFGELVNLQLDADQRGWGFTPIISLDFHEGPVNVTARYEFRTRICVANETNQLSARLKNTDPATAAVMPYIEGEMALSQFGNAVNPYRDGNETRYDMPSLLSLAVGYEFTPKLRATAEYHFYDDKHAKMSQNRQEYLEHGTNEFLLGVEYDINDKFTVSCGGQRTDYGLADGYQQNTSFACDSYSFGLGGAMNITEKLRLNVGYFMSIYSDYEKQSALGTEVYSRTNYVAGIGIDYKF